jgi:flagellum-specific ATP synthase
MPFPPGKNSLQNGVTAAARLIAHLGAESTVRVIGTVEGASEHALVVTGLARAGSIGDIVEIEARDGREVHGEIVAFNSARAIVMPYSVLTQIGPGCGARLRAGSSTVAPDPSWIGTILDGLGRVLGTSQAPQPGARPYDLRRAPPPPFGRGMQSKPVDVGVTAINTFLTCGYGQRLGIFAGSGVGKTTLLGMLAAASGFDAIVVALIGERGKELQDFLDRFLTPEARQRSILVVSTSDEPAVIRRRAAHLAVTLAEFLRDRGARVLFLMDSVTRYAGALREIGLAAGEPVTASGYPASVFAQLPKLLERLGPDGEGRSITAFLTVLVEGDDMNEPVSDATRGFLDGHIALDRRIADAGRYPPVDVLRSVSRAIGALQTAEQKAAVRRSVELESAYREIEDLYRLSLYKLGTDPETDRAIRFHAGLETLLRQEAGISSKMNEDFRRLGDLIRTIEDRHCQPDPPPKT